MGFFTVLICLSAIWLNFIVGNIILMSLAIVATIGCLWSWLIMHKIDKAYARQRADYAGVFFDLRENEVAAIPNWLTWINMICTLSGLCLVLVGIYYYIIMGPGSSVTLFSSFLILFVSGLLLFLFIGNALDAVLFRLAVGFGDPLHNILTHGPNPRRHFILNTLRPVVLTVAIFGGGLFTMALLGLSFCGNILAGLWFLFLTQISCLSGRRHSLRQAGWAMIITTGLLIGIFYIIIYS